MSQLSALCEAKKLRAEVTMTDAPLPEGFDRNGYAWKVTLSYKGRRLTVPFYTGSACGEPEAADVVSCLISDGRAGEESFSEFCAEFGYDEDSRKAEKTWKACKLIAPRIRRLLGNDYDQFDRAEH